jgi:hypothetical protein
MDECGYRLAKLDKLAILLGNTDVYTNTFLILYKGFNSIYGNEYNCGDRYSLFTDYDYLFIFVRTNAGYGNFVSHLYAFLIKDFKPEHSEEILQILEIHRETEEIKKCPKLLKQIIELCYPYIFNPRNPNYKKMIDLFGSVRNIKLNDDIWERFYKLVVGTTRCKSARAFS